MTKLNHKKTPSFGIGAKATNAGIRRCLKEQPDPGTYDIMTIFDKNIRHKKGHTFGINHSYYMKLYSEQLINTKAGWTDPGAHDIKSFVDIKRIDRRKFTFGSRLNTSPKQSPGPGEYKEDETESLNKVGRYTNYKYRNSGSRNFSKGRRKTFMEVRSATPGPGTYKEVLRISKEKN